MKFLKQLFLLLQKKKNLRSEWSYRFFRDTFSYSSHFSLYIGRVHRKFHEFEIQINKKKKKKKLMKTETRIKWKESSSFAPWFEFDTNCMVESIKKQTFLNYFLVDKTKFYTYIIILKKH